MMLALLAGAMAWTTYRNYRVIEDIQHHEMRVQDLRAQILFLDEVLTNSCSLAAATGEPRWEERYQRFLPKLDAAIAQAVELVPATKEELAEVDGANAALVQVEDHALALVRQKQATQAWELLNGKEYQRNKQEYADGLVSFSNRLEEHSELAIQAAHREAMWFLIAALCLGSLVAFMFLVGIYCAYRLLRLRSGAGLKCSPMPSMYKIGSM